MNYTLEEEQWKSDWSNIVGLAATAGTCVCVLYNVIYVPICHVFHSTLPPFSYTVGAAMLKSKT